MDSQDGEELYGPWYEENIQNGDFSSNGERIYFAGIDDQGERIEFTGGPHWLYMHGGYIVGGYNYSFIPSVIEAIFIAITLFGLYIIYGSIKEAG